MKIISPIKKPVSVRTFSNLFFCKNVFPNAQKWKEILSKNNDKKILYHNPKTLNGIKMKNKGKTHFIMQFIKVNFITTICLRTSTIE